MFRSGLLIAFCLLLIPGRITLAGSGTDAVVEAVQAECAAIDGGLLTLEADAIQRLDLTGDGRPDEVIDGRDLSCSSSRTLFCGGTGGCRLFLVVGESVTEEMSKGWKLVRLGHLPVLLLQVHGSRCGGTNLRSCVKALVWSEGAFRAIGGD
ncbi:hypothetical protein [Nisaea sp.]|uniref:hypothetical protein n=1 Tax=Nisaea sp. TaxID=2024842 RepID=UPI003B52022F